MAERLLKIYEAAERTGYREATVRYKILTRQWPFVKLGKSKFASVRIRESFIDELIEQNEVPARVV